MSNRLRHTTLLVSLALCAGCTSMRDWNHDRRVSRYGRKHANRPATLIAGARQREPMVGMTAEEVTLCLGAPDGETPPKTDSDGFTWHYNESSSVRGDIRGSSMWDVRVPTWEIEFDSTGVVSAVTRYDKGHPIILNAATPATKQVETRPPIERSRRTLPRPVTVTPIESDFTGWPHLTLNGVTAKGGDATAVLNGEVVEPGERIKGVTVKQIAVNGILLEYKGRKGFLAPSQSTRTTD